MHLARLYTELDDSKTYFRQIETLLKRALILFRRMEAEADLQEVRRLLGNE